MRLPPRIRSAWRALTAPNVRRYEAAGGGRRWSAAPQFGSHGPETLAAAPQIRSRARFFSANNAWAANGVATLVSSTIGTGIKPSPRHADADARQRAAAAFAQWADAADAEGRATFAAMQAEAARAMFVDGEVFARLFIDADGLRVQLIPAEQVAEDVNRELDSGGQIVAGIEFDARGRRVAYHVRPERPVELFGTYAEPVRVPAEDMLHIFMPAGIGAPRGVSWLAPVLLRLGELDALEDALLVGAKISALFAGFLHDAHGDATGQLFEGSTVGDILETGLEPGTLKVLPPGVDVKFSNPGEASESVAFGAHQLRAVAAGLGIPAHLLTGDLRDANYSSLRAALVAFRQRVEAIQRQVLIPNFCAPIWRRALTVEALAGRLDLPGFDADPASALAVEWRPPAMPWVDPEREAKAEAAAIEAGLKSRSQAIAERGLDAETVDAERAADAAREAQLGLNTGESQNA